MRRSMHRNFRGNFQGNFEKPQYSIYAYNTYCADKFGHNEWQCVGHLQSEDKALQRAKKLFDTRKFAKIEIKKKFFDMKQNRHLVSTFQVLERKKTKQQISLLCASLMGIAAIGLFVLEVI